MPLDDGLRHAQLAADRADLVLEQLTERLHQLEPQLLRQPADVVVRLDGRARSLEAHRLDHVRVEGALREEARLAPQALGHLLGLRLEDLDERRADDLALLLGVGDARQPVEEQGRRVDGHQVQVEALGECVLHLLELARAQQPVVHEYARQLVADGLVQERRGHRRVDAAAQPQDHVVVADLLADGGHLLVDERARRPVAAEVADLGDEVAQDGRAVLGVDHLGVELDAVDGAVAGVRLGGDGGDGRVVSRRDGAEAHRQLREVVAVAHPHHRALRDTAEQVVVLMRDDG